MSGRRKIEGDAAASLGLHDSDLIGKTNDVGIGVGGDDGSSVASCVGSGAGCDDG